MLRRSSLLIAPVFLVFTAPVSVWSQLQPPAPSSRPDPDSLIECEFRVFDGEDEVTSDSSVHIFPTGTRQSGIPIQPADGRLLVHVAPAIYDAQVVRLKEGQVSNIRWSERLVIMRYPDENGRHLEVINFRPRFGALQVVGDGAEFEITAFAPALQPTPESERRAVGRVVKGVGYQLLIAPAARYDVRIRTGAGAQASDRWLLEIEIPADRTRLKSAGGS